MTIPLRKQPWNPGATVNAQQAADLLGGLAHRHPQPLRGGTAALVQAHAPRESKTIISGKTVKNDDLRENRQK